MPRTPLMKRLPVVAGLVAGIVIAAVVGGSVWVRVPVFFATVFAWSLMLRYGFGVPWSRMLSYEEPHPLSDDPQRDVREES